MTKKLLAAFCGHPCWQWVLRVYRQRPLYTVLKGSPEGFNPAFYTAGTTFDVSSRQVFNKLVELSAVLLRLFLVWLKKWMFLKMDLSTPSI